METNGSNNKLLLIDGHAMIYRAWFSIPERLSSKSGVDTRGVFGFLSTLFKTISNHNPTNIILTLDPKGPTFRHKTYPEYKAHRPPTPPELHNQIPMVEKIMESFRIPVFCVDNYEADDLLGTISNLSAKENFENLIVTGDKDILQLINNNTKVLLYSGFGETKVYDELVFSKRKEFLGLSPQVLPDQKGLVGDPSDNIKGVPGIGEKAANKLLNAFGTLDNIYKNINEILNLEIRGAKRVQSLLLEYEEQAFQSKDLATIFTKVPLDLNLSDSRFGDFDRRKVIKDLTDLDLMSLINRIPSISSNNTNIQGNMFLSKIKQPKKYLTVKSESMMNLLIKTIQEKKCFSFDTAPSSLNPFDSDLVGISISVEPYTGWYIPIAHEDKIYNIDENLIKIIKSIFENEKIEKIAHNANFDVSVLINNNFTVKNIYFDTMIAANLLGKRSLSLKNLALEYFNEEMTPIDHLIGKRKDQISFSTVSIDSATKYSCAESDMTLRLKAIFENELEKSDLLNVMENIEMPLLPVIVNMQKHGVRINEKKLNKLSLDLKKTIISLEKQSEELLPDIEFNLRSSQQLAKILIENLGVPKTRKTKTGYTMDANTLEGLLEYDELDPKAKDLIRIILSHRESSKIKSTYADSLPNLINKRTGRVHTYFNQAGTSTGRLSSSDPNLQNIPVRTELGNQVRKAFESKISKGYFLMSADYSQVELKILAHFSEEPILINAFMNNEDIHDMTAKSIYETTTVTKEQRRIAKILNFGVIYGLSPHGVARQTNLNREQGKQFIDLYFGKYPGIQEYTNKIIKFAQEHHYVETLTGRKRLLQEINSPNFNIRSSSERMAINMPIQGTAADIIKIAMIKIDKEIQKLNLNSRMIMQVHDELIFEVHQKELSILEKTLRDIMPNALKLKVPLTIDVNISKSWGDLK